MTWDINGQVGPHSEPGVDGHGWLWELERDGDARRVFVEIAGTAFAVHDAGGSGLADETREAIETEGRSEVERAAAMDSPPRIVKCSTVGCRDVFPENPREA